MPPKFENRTTCRARYFTKVYFYDNVCAKSVILPNHEKTEVPIMATATKTEYAAGMSIEEWVATTRPTDSTFFDNICAPTIDFVQLKLHELFVADHEGLVGFTLESCEEGGTAHVYLAFTGGSTLDPQAVVVRKYNTNTNTYTTLTSENSNLEVSRTTLGSLRIEYDITDGGELDQDGVANGTIVDPVGPALSAVSAPNTGLGRLQL